MTPQIYDYKKGCFVMRGPTEIINAFHPDFVKTHMPQFLTSVRVDEQYAKSAATLSKSVTKLRRTKPSHGNVAGMSTRESDIYQPARDMGAFPKTREKQTLAEFVNGLTPAQKAKLEPRDFHIFTKAGNAASKGKKK